MATKIVTTCDRCGAALSYSEDAAASYKADRYAYLAAADFDLCGPCHDAFVAWLRTPPERPAGD